MSIPGAALAANAKREALDPSSGVQSGGPVNNTSRAYPCFWTPASALAGAYPYEALESLAVSYIEVLRGANAFDYGALNLGGGVNFASHTGYDASPLQLRFERAASAISRRAEFWNVSGPPTIT